MSSERIQHRIERLLGQAKEATDRHDWEQANQIAEDVLAIDPDNGDAKAYIDSHQQRRIELLLDQVEEAADRRDWYQVRLFAGDILAIDPSNVDAQTYIVAAERIIKEHGLPEEFFDEAQKGNYEVVIESHSGGGFRGHLGKKSEISHPPGKGRPYPQIPLSEPWSSDSPRANKDRMWHVFLFSVTHPG